MHELRGDAMIAAAPRGAGSDGAHPRDALARNASAANPQVSDKLVVDPNRLPFDSASRKSPAARAVVRMPS